MLIVAITGGIATGKSTAAQQIVAGLNCPFFSADACVRELLDSDLEVRDQIRAAFGESVLGPNLQVDRSKLREIVFEDERNRRCLESILHPRVRAAWQGKAEALRSASDFFVTEIPLLFETGGDAFCDRVITVGCLVQTQLDRLTQYRGLSREIGARIIATQTPLEEKMRQSNYVVWNDSCTLESLAAQCRLISAHLTGSPAGPHLTGSTAGPHLTGSNAGSNIRQAV